MLEKSSETALKTGVALARGQFIYIKIWRETERFKTKVVSTEGGGLSFGHVVRCDGLSKYILQGTMEGRVLLWLAEKMLDR